MTREHNIVIDRLAFAMCVMVTLMVATTMLTSMVFGKILGLAQSPGFWVSGVGFIRAFIR